MKNLTRTKSRPARTTLLPVVLAVLLLGITSGCIIIPTPEHDDWTSPNRKNVSAKSRGRFHIGETTMQEVVLELGEPDAISADGRRIAYHWDKVKAYFAVGGGGTGAAGPITKDYYLRLDFDQAGVLIEPRQGSSLLGIHSPAAVLEDPSFGHSPAATAKHAMPSAAVQGDDVVWLRGRVQWYPGQEHFTWAKSWFTDPQLVEAELIATDAGVKCWPLSPVSTAKPARDLNLAYAAIAECRVDSSGRKRSLVLRSAEGGVHSFVFRGNYGRLDERKAESAREFIQSRMAGSSTDAVKRKIETAGPFLITLAPRSSPATAARPPANPIPVNVLATTDQRAERGRIGERFAAFGVSMGDVHFSGSVPDFFRSRLMDQVRLMGNQVTSSGDGLRIAPQLTKFWVTTKTSPLYWDIIAEVDCELLFEPTHTPAGRTARHYAGRKTHRTYLWPSSSLMGRTLEESLDDLFGKVRADAVWTFFKQRGDTKDQ